MSRSLAASNNGRVVQGLDGARQRGEDTPLPSEQFVIIFSNEDLKRGVNPLKAVQRLAPVTMYQCRVGDDEIVFDGGIPEEAELVSFVATFTQPLQSLTLAVRRPDGTIFSNGGESLQYNYQPGDSAGGFSVIDGDDKAQFDYEVLDVVQNVTTEGDLEITGPGDLTVNIALFEAMLVEGFTVEARVRFAPAQPATLNIS